MKVVKKILSFLDYVMIASLIAFIGVPIILLIAYIITYIHITDNYIRLFSYNYDAIKSFLKWFYFLLWVAIVFLIYRAKLYSFLTDGRRYLKDARFSGKGFIELVKFYKKADAHKMRILDLPKMKWTEASGAIISHVGKRLLYKPTDGDGQNIAVFGIPGVGKTESIAKTSALRWGMTLDNKQTAAVYCIDYKGDISISTSKYRKIKFFEPEHPERSCHFDPFADIYRMNKEVRSEFLEKLAAIIIPDENNKEGDGQYFVETARDFLVGATHYYLGTHKKATFPEVVDFIIHTNPKELITNAKNSTNEEAKTYLDAYYQNNERNLGGAFSQLVKRVRAFKKDALFTLLNSDGKCISVNDLEKGIDVYIRISQTNQASYYSLVSVITMQFLNAFTSRSEDPEEKKKLKPVLMLLDEMNELKLSLKFLSQSLATLRSKKISCLLLSQNLGQWKDLYGDAFTSLLGNIHYISIVSVTDNFTREYFSANAGTHDYFIESTTQTKDGSSRSVSVKENQPIFQPADFGNLTDKQNGRYESINIVYGKCAKTTLCNFKDFKG